MSPRLSHVARLASRPAAAEGVRRRTPDSLLLAPKRMDRPRPSVSEMARARPVPILEHVRQSSLVLSSYTPLGAEHDVRQRRRLTLHFPPSSSSPSSGKNMQDLVHVAVGGGGGLLRTAAVLTRAQVGRVPVPPVMLGVRLLVVAVALLRLAEELCKGCDVYGSRSRQLPLAAGKSRLDLLEQPAVPVRILERGKREVGTTLRVAPADAWVLHGVVEGAAGVVEDLSNVDAVGDQVVAGGVDVVHGEGQAVRRARLG